MENKEITDFIKQLVSSKRELQQKCRFYQEHGLEHEASFIRNKIKIIEEIQFKLELVAEGKQQGLSITFAF